MISTLMITISAGVAFGMAIVALTVACLAYAKMVGMEKSTHRIEWRPVPGQPQGPAVNDLPDSELGDGNETQDLPKGLAPKGPLTLKQQMQQFMYPDIENEQV